MKMRIRLYIYVFLFVLFTGAVIVQSAEAQYGIGVTSDRTSYKPGDMVTITVVAPKENRVTVQVKNPSNETILLETTDTTHNVAAIEFRLNDNAEMGNYTIHASSISDDKEQHASATESFAVSMDSEGIDTLTIPGFVTPSLLASIGAAGALATFFRVGRH